ncbi:MAG: HDOD domain-containing protein [Deltaproteobacteria bacterium]|jgi:HD-like signal output (HDOD) protein|nr:HDOD domain-containing protein [Deltaproteobacteria bacterium]
MKMRYEKAQAFLTGLVASSPELPFEPTLLPDLFASTADNSMKPTQHIAELVERSQGLATRILRLANSAYYGMQTAVSSLSHAIRLLGLNEVRNIILQIGVSSMLNKMAFPKGFPFEELWEHHILTANLARTIARCLPPNAFGQDNSLGPDEIYAAGLLHDMGKTLLASQCAEDWLAIQDLATCDNIPFYKAEEDYWGLDHSVVGARMLTFWGLPPGLTELVGWHHAPLQAKGAHITPTRILAAANLLAHQPPAALFPEQKDGAALVLPAEIAAILPETLDRAKLAAGIKACSDTDKVRSMAAAAMGR